MNNDIYFIKDTLTRLRNEHQGNPEYIKAINDVQSALSDYIVMKLQVNKFNPK